MISAKKLNLFRNKTQLLKDLNIEFNKGEFWAILGKNGTGKTSLLHTLAGLSEYTSGNILIEGKELSSIKPIDRAQSIALLSQIMESGLDCTVEQTISYGRYAWNRSKQNIEDEKVIIDQAINEMQLDKLRHKSIQKISGGELRKVEIATILAQNSDILLFDEPLNHLDLSFRSILMDVLKKLSDKKIIIMVTHDIQYVKAYCTDVLMLLEKGQYAYGKTDDVMNQNNINKMFAINLPENVFI
ncbi:MAG: ABC transporter ATP-binding protein [Marinicellaceae bacterium]